jgi:hypothetical protein
MHKIIPRVQYAFLLETFPESAKKEKKRSRCTQLGRAWRMFVAAGERFEGARQLT